MIIVGEFLSMTYLSKETIRLKFGALSHSWHFSNRRCAVEKKLKTEAKADWKWEMFNGQINSIGAWLWYKIKHRPRWTSRIL